MQPNLESRIEALETHIIILSEELIAERRSKLLKSILLNVATAAITVGLFFHFMPEQKPQQEPTYPGLQNEKVGSV